MDRRAGTIAVVASAACFATLGALTKWAFANGANPVSLLAVRFTGAAIVLWVAQSLRAPASLRVTRRSLLRFAALSLTGYGAASLCYMFAVREVGAAVTTVLLFTYPALVALIGWLFLGEAFPPRRVVAVVMTFGGCALVSEVVTAYQTVNAPGLLLGLGAGLAYAVYSVLSCRTLEQSPRLTLMAYTFAFSAGGMTALAALTGDLTGVLRWEPAAWVALVLIVAIPTFAAVVLYLGGMRSMGTQRAAVLSTLELPFTVLLAAALYADERLSVLQMIGAAVVLAGVVLAEWDTAPGEVEAPAV